MDTGAFVDQYFISPIWDKSGYNMVNTLAYAIVALISVYLVYLYMQRKKEGVSNEFVAGALAFTLFGSSLRVITDSISAGTMQKFASAGASGPIANMLYPQILSSHALDYGYLTVSPGIYIIVAALFLSAYALERKLGIRNLAAGIGLAGGVASLVVLSPMFVNWIYLAYILALVSVVFIAAYAFLGLREFLDFMPIVAQALDGAGTWVAIDWFRPDGGAQYWEQHVLSGGIGGATPLGYGLFFILKAAFAAAAVYALRGEKNAQAGRMALLVIMIIGFAPGLRTAIRLLAGT